MLKRLDHHERMRLMKFVCSFAWADLEIKDSERKFVARMMDRLELTAAERKHVAEWLTLPPPIEEVDPTHIPKEHKQLFLDAARAMIVVDGDVDPEEAENLRLLEQLIAP